MFRHVGEFARMQRMPNWRGRVILVCGMKMRPHLQHHKPLRPAHAIRMPRCNNITEIAYYKYLE